MIHALQELKKLKEGQSILLADVDYLKNKQPVNRFLATNVENRSHLRQLGRYLKEQGRFPNSRISPDEDQTSCKV